MHLSSGPDWGNVPAWVGSILTGLSILIAAIAYRRSVLDKEREHATKVSAWVVSKPYLGGEEALDPSRDYCIVVKNSGDGAVYDVIVTARNLDHPIEFSSIGPNEVASERLPSIVSPRTVVKLRFVDNSGRVWFRDYNGRLHALGGPDMSYEQVEQIWVQTREDSSSSSRLDIPDPSTYADRRVSRMAKFLRRVRRQQS